MKNARKVTRERREHLDRVPARTFRLYLDMEAPFYFVEVRIARNRRHMRAETSRLDGRMRRENDRRCMGLVKSYCSPITRQPKPIAGLVARMYLNVNDLRARPSEIVAHECGHAAMAWARLRRADLNLMTGEEVMCHALGRLVQQLNRVCYAHWVWPP